MTTPTTNSKESLRLTLERARREKEALEARQSKLTDVFMAAELSANTTKTFMDKNNRLNDRIGRLDEEIARCRKALDALPFS